MKQYESSETIKPIMSLLPHHLTILLDRPSRYISGTNGAREFARDVIFGAFAEDDLTIPFNGTVITYTEDLLGPENIHLENLRFRLTSVVESIQQVLSDGGRDLIRIGLGNDPICDSCWIGAHCLQRTNEEDVREGNDVAALECFYKWYKLSNHTSSEEDLIRLFSYLPSNLDFGIEVFSTIIELIRTNLIHIETDDQERITGICLPFKVAFTPEFAAYLVPTLKLRVLDLFISDDVLTELFGESVAYEVREILRS